MSENLILVTTPVKINMFTSEYNQQSGNDEGHCLNISATGIIFYAYACCLLFNIFQYLPFFNCYLFNIFKTVLKTVCLSQLWYLKPGMKNTVNEI